MPAILSKKEKLLANVLPQPPSLLITMPFEPKLTGAKQLEQQVCQVIKRAERLLLSVYQKKEVKTVIGRLEVLFRTLNYHCFKKSIAAHVSISSQKMFYLDLDLEEQISIHNSLAVRDLLRLKKNPIRYLVVVLNDAWAKTYVANDADVKIIKTDTPRPFTDVHESPFNRIVSGKKIVPDSFYKQLCNDFSLIIAAYQLPVFLIGSVTNVNRFCHLVKSKKEIVQVMYNKTDNISDGRILQHIEPYLDKWDIIRQRYLRRQLEEADRHNLVRYGIPDILKTVKQSACKILMVEERLIYPQQHEPVHEINNTGQVVLRAICKEIQLDNIIQVLLENGVEIEIVPDNMLEDYDGIALVNHYSIASPVFMQTTPLLPFL